VRGRGLGGEGARGGEVLLEGGEGGAVGGGLGVWVRRLCGCG
jgi:hypothetical protein